MKMKEIGLFWESLVYGVYSKSHLKGKGRCQDSKEKADKPKAAEIAFSKDLCIEVQTAGSSHLKERRDIHAKLDKGGLWPTGMFFSFPGTVCSMKYWVDDCVYPTGFGIYARVT